MKTGPQFVSKTIKNLERRYGSSVDYYQPYDKTTNLATGAQSCSYRSTSIRRALLLPFKLTRGFTYDTAFLAAGNGDAKNLSFGAFHDNDESTVLVQKSELKFSPKMDDHVTWKSKRFDVKDIQTFPDIQIYVFTVVRTQSCKDYYFRTMQTLTFENSEVLG